MKGISTRSYFVELSEDEIKKILQAFKYATQGGYIVENKIAIEFNRLLTSYKVNIDET